MAKKQFDNVVSNIVKPKPRVTSMSELFEDEKVPIATETNQHINRESSERKEDIDLPRDTGIIPATSISSPFYPSVAKQQVIEGQQPSTKQYKGQNVEKVVRDGFSMPEEDYYLIRDFIRKAGLLGHITSKSEVLRAALHALSKLPDDKFLQSLQQLARLKPGKKPY